MISAPEEWALKWLTLAEREMEKGNVTDAVHNVTTAILQIRAGATPAEYAMLHFHRGMYQFLNDNRKAAREDWEIAIRCQPDRADATRFLARLLLLAPVEYRDPQRAIRLLATDALVADPDAEVLVLLGIAKYRQARWAEAKETLSRVLNSAQEELAG